ncbi:MAG: GNAT family N-acetyltransferase [Methylacidiphilales bacterium]|nr:GNAT family N-acetyltransferase [Candidatus Methylacidiphilales bacterium]
MIRLATEADLPALMRLNAMVQELHARREPESFKILSDEAACIEWFRKILAEPANCVFVAEKDQSVIGYLFAQEVKREESWMRPPAHLFMLEHIAVAPEFQRKGYGHALMGRFFSEAKRRGIPRAEVVHWGFNDAAGRFFKRYGFTTLHLRLAAVVP